MKLILPIAVHIRKKNGCITDRHPETRSRKSEDGAQQAATSNECRVVDKNYFGRVIYGKR